MSGASSSEAFTQVEYPGEWDVLVRIEGSAGSTIKADTVEAARSVVTAMMAAGEFEIYSNDAEDSRIVSVRPRCPMYLVRRAGQNMQVSHLALGDEPRQLADGF